MGRGNSTMNRDTNPWRQQAGRVGRPFQAVPGRGASMTAPSSGSFHKVERNSFRSRCMNAPWSAGWRPFRADDRVLGESSQGFTLGYRMTPRCGYARPTRSRRPDHGPKRAEFECPVRNMRSAGAAAAVRPAEVRQPKCHNHANEPMRRSRR